MLVRQEKMENKRIWKSNLGGYPVKLLMVYTLADKWSLAESDENMPLFVNKQQFTWSASITLDNNNYVLIAF